MRNPIEKATTRKTFQYCSCCSSDATITRIQEINIKTSENSSQTIAICKECTEKMTVFLINLWKD